MNRLSRRPCTAQLGGASLVEPSSAANLKSSLGFIDDRVDALRPSSTNVSTAWSAAFPSSTISFSPLGKFAQRDANGAVYRGGDSLRVYTVHTDPASGPSFLAPLYVTIGLLI